MANRVNAGQNFPGLDENSSGTCGRRNLTRHKGRCQPPDQAPRRRSARVSSDFRLSKASPKAKPASNRRTKTQRSVLSKKRKATRIQERGRVDYKGAIWKVKEVFCPGTSISDMAMQIVNDFINDMFERISTEAMKIVQQDKKATLSTQSIYTAIRLIFPPEMRDQVLLDCQTAARKALHKRK